METGPSWFKGPMRAALAYLEMGAPARAAPLLRRALEAAEDPAVRRDLDKRQRAAQRPSGPDLLRSACR